MPNDSMSSHRLSRCRSSSRSHSRSPLRTRSIAGWYIARQASANASQSASMPRRAPSARPFRNTGNHPEFTIPGRIHVFVDAPLIPGGGDVDVTVVDTKGIDETVARADLEKHLGASHTVLILCSGFNDAPGTEATDLLRRASEAGINGDGLQGVVLGLPKFDEALQMLDDAGEPAGSIDEGYGLKAGIVEETVHQSLGFNDFSVRFLNSHEDDPAQVRQDLSERVHMVFNGYRNTVGELVESAKGLVENYENEQAQEVVGQAAVLVRSWINRHMDLHPVKREAERSLLREVEGAHPATIHATMRRKGGWYNLDYGHHLAYGSRLVVSSVPRTRVQSLGELCDTFLEPEEHHHARSLLSQAQRALETYIPHILIVVSRYLSNAKIGVHGVHRYASGETLSSSSTCRCSAVSSGSKVRSGWPSHSRTWRWVRLNKRNTCSAVGRWVVRSSG